jgi:hypothetical protein
MTALLVDTSVWVEHFSGRRPDFAERLDSSRVHIHEFVFGELILGTIPAGDPALVDLADTPRIETRQHHEVVAFVRGHRLEGSGIGWPDAHILAAAKAAGAQLWTLDKSLIRAAARVGVPA